MIWNAIRYGRPFTRLMWHMTPIENRPNRGGLIDLHYIRDPWNPDRMMFKSDPEYNRRAITTLPDNLLPCLKKVKETIWESEDRNGK